MDAESQISAHSPLRTCALSIFIRLFHPWRNSFSTRALPLFDEQPLIHTWRENHALANTFTQEYSHLSCFKIQKLKKKKRKREAQMCKCTVRRHVQEVFIFVSSADRKLQFEYLQLRRDPKCIRRVRSSGSAGFHCLQSRQDTERGRFILFDSDFKCLKKSRSLKLSVL